MESEFILWNDTGWENCLDMGGHWRQCQCCRPPVGQRSLDSSTGYGTVPVTAFSYHCVCSGVDVSCDVCAESCLPHNDICSHFWWLQLFDALWSLGWHCTIHYSKYCPAVLKDYGQNSQPVLCCAVLILALLAMEMHGKWRKQANALNFKLFLHVYCFCFCRRRCCCCWIQFLVL